MAKKKHAYTAIGFYADNNQPWMAHVFATDSTDAADRGMRKIYDNGHSGPDLEDIFIVEVIKGWVKGCLENDKVYNTKEPPVLEATGYVKP